MASRVEAPAVPTVTLKIDDREVTVPRGTNIIEAARQVGIDIPYLCYHHQLTSFGGCRLCLVEVEKAPKLLAACNTTVADGMVVRTTTEKVKSQREGTIEFILLNHPLDCPVCDKGGECELQDRTFEHSNARSRMTEPKIHIEDYDLGPLIVRNQDRCIICKRCIKVMEEVAGEPVLEFGQRGVTTEVYTFEHEGFRPGFSGNTIRVCPVGALMSKPFRFRARPWELIKTPSLCTMCGVGCNVRADVRENQLLRLVGLENKQVNDAWLCDRGQFGYDYINSPERLAAPLIRRDGRLQEASWAEVFDFLAPRLQGLMESGPGAFAALGGARLSNEDLYALRRFTEDVIGSPNLDHRPSGTGGDYLQRRPRPGDIETLPSSEVVLLFATDLTAEAPVLDLVLKRSLLPKRMKLIVASPRRTALCKFADSWLQYRPGSELQVIAALKQAAAGAAGGDETAGVAGAAFEAAGALWREAEIASILFGQDLAEAVDGPDVLAALEDLARSTGKRDHPGHLFMEVVRDANTWGARLLSLLPGREGRGTLQMLEGLRAGAVRCLWVAGCNPAVEAPDPAAAEALQNAELLVVQDLFLTETAKLAHVVLPAVPVTETNSTYINIEGRVQRAIRAMNARGAARELWAVLDELSDRLGKPLEFGDAGGVSRQLREALSALPEAVDVAPRASAPAPAVATPGTAGLTLFTGRLMFGSDSLQRESAVLRSLAPAFFAEMHPSDAVQQGLTAGEEVVVSTDLGSVRGLLSVTPDLPQGAVFIPDGYCDMPAVRLLAPGARTAACRVESAANADAQAEDGA